MLLEFIRRVQREWDAYVLGRQSWHLSSPTVRQASSSSSGSDDEGGKTPNARTSAVKIEGESGEGKERVGGALLFAQTIRAFIYTCQFAVAYIVMLLAMYYNGYIIICIFIGAFLGHFTFGWDLARKS